MNSKKILKINNLNVEFSKEKTLIDFIFRQSKKIVKAVDDVDLEIDEGEIIGLVGESGSGKSSLIKALVGVNKIKNGRIFYQDQEINYKKRDIKNFLSKQFQMVFQDPYSSLNPRMIVKDIIQEPLDIHTTMSTNEKKDKVDWLLNKVGLSAEQATRYPHEFSGGQRQRIGIARSLATDPKIIIADEPVSALDVSIQAQIINLMMDLQEEFSLSIIFIAHDLSVVKHISNRIGVMYLGELVEINETTEIFKNPVHNYTKTLLKAIPEPNPEGREERKLDRLKS